MKNFETGFLNTRIRGIYSCGQDISHDIVTAAVAYCVAQLLAAGATPHSLCARPDLITDRIAAENGFEGCGIHVVIEDIGPKPAVVSQKVPKEWQCSCGKSNRGNFCVACGSFRPQSAPKFCWYCGTKTQEGDIFCGSCGNKLK